MTKKQCESGVPYLQQRNRTGEWSMKMVALRNIALSVKKWYQMEYLRAFSLLFQTFVSIFEALPLHP